MVSYLSRPAIIPSEKTNLIQCRNRPHDPQKPGSHFQKSEKYKQSVNINAVRSRSEEVPFHSMLLRHVDGSLQISSTEYLASTQRRYQQLLVQPLKEQGDRKAQTIDTFSFCPFDYISIVVYNTVVLGQAPAALQICNTDSKGKKLGLGYLYLFRRTTPSFDL